MPLWIIAAAVVSIAVTAVLTLILWRMNAGAMQEARKAERSADATQYGGDTGGSRHDRNESDQGDSAGGGDGGGD